MKLLLLAVLFVAASYGQACSFDSLENCAELPNFPVSSLALYSVLTPLVLSGDVVEIVPYEDVEEEDYPFNYPTSLIENEIAERAWELWPVTTRRTVEEATDGQTAFETMIDQTQSANGGIDPLIDFANKECGQAIVRYVTATALPISYFVGTPPAFDPFLQQLNATGFFFPAGVSYDVCNDVLKKCTEPNFPAAGIDRLIPYAGKCRSFRPAESLQNGLVTIPEQYRFAANTTYIALGQAFTNIPSITFTEEAEYDISCQSPLEFRKKDWKAGKDVRPCERNCLGYFFYSENQWDSMKILMAVISWFCTIADINLMIVLLMSPKNRRYPGIMSVFMAVAGIFICLPFMVAAITGIEEFLCKDNFRPADSDDGLCVWQASFVLFGGLLGLLTWSALAVNTYVTLHLRWKIDNTKWGIATYIIVLGYPTTAVIIGTSTKDFAYKAPLPYCWWTTTGLEWGVFYSIDIMCCFVSIFCIIFVLYELRNIQDSSKGKKAKYLKLIRVFAFLVLFLEIAIYLIIIQSISQSRSDTQWTEAGTSYGQCLLVDQEKCERPPDGEMILAASQWYWLLANITGVGLPVVMVFGTTAPVFFFWCRAVQNVRSGKGIAEGLTSTSSSSASSRGSWAGPQDGDEDSFDPDA